MHESNSRLYTVLSLAGLFKHVPFSNCRGPYTSVQPVRRSSVNHTTIAISAYRQVPLLHLSGVKQWFTGGSVQPLYAMTGTRTHDLACAIPVSYPRHPKMQTKHLTPCLKQGPIVPWQQCQPPAYPKTY